MGCERDRTAFVLLSQLASLAMESTACISALLVFLEDSWLTFLGPCASSSWMTSHRREAMIAQAT